MINKTLVYFAPPYIKNRDTTYRVQYVDKDGNQVRQYQDPKNKPERQGDMLLIGNGSVIELNVCVFDTKTKGKGHRLEGIRILDLVEYKPKERQEEAEAGVPAEAVQPVAEAPAEAPVPKKNDKVIPF